MPPDRGDGTAADRIAELVRGLVDDTLDPAGLRELADEVRRIARQTTWRRLDSLAMAEEVEQETWRKLMRRVRRPDYMADPIRHGGAFVRSTAESVCADLGSGITRRRQEVPADEHEADVDRVSAEPAATDAVAFPVRPGIDEELTTDHGLVSERLRADLRDMDPLDVQILFLREQDYSYAEISNELEGVVTPGAAQRRGERATQELRGRAAVAVWSLKPVAAWEPPGCEELADLQREVAAVLAAGRTPTAKLFQKVGRHIDRNPNRVRGRDPACELCRDEHAVTVRMYEALVAQVPALVEEARRRWSWRLRRLVRGRRRPSAARGGPDMTGAAGRTGQVVGSVLAMLLLMACCGVCFRAGQAIDLERWLASPSTAPSTPAASGSRRASPPARVPTVPDLCTLVTPAEVANRLGTTSMRPCTANPAGADGTRVMSVATFNAVSGRNGNAPDQVVLSLQAADTTARVADDCRFSTVNGTVPGLGDENCYTMDGTSPSVGGRVLVRKGGQLLVIQVAMVGMTRNGLIRLATYVTGRLP